MGKMKEIAIQEEQLEMFEDVSPEMLALEDSVAYYDINPDWNDLEVTEITLEEFDTMVAPYSSEYNVAYDTTIDISYTPSWTGVSENDVQDYLVTPSQDIMGVGITLDNTQEEMYKREIRELQECLYKSYARVKELSEEVSALKEQLDRVTTIHKNTRTF